MAAAAAVEQMDNAGVIAEDTRAVTRLPP